MKTMFVSMFIRTGLFALSASTTLSLGCLDSQQGSVRTDTSETTLVGPQSFSLTYISGHLGYYDNCVDQAVPVGGMSPASAAGGMAAGEGAAPDAGACPDDVPEDECGVFPTCEHAELNLRLTNTGEVELAAIALTDVELILEPGEGVVVTEALSVEAGASLALADATVAAGESVTIRVTFRGLAAYMDYASAAEAPADRRDGDAAGGTNAARVHVIFATTETSAEATSPALYVVSAIDT